MFRFSLHKENHPLSYGGERISEFIYKHGALAGRYRQGLLLILIENMDREVIELLALKPDLPASDILVGEYGDAVLLQRQILNTHLLKRLHCPVHGLSWQGYIEADDILYDERNRNKAYHWKISSSVFNRSIDDNSRAF